jgi:NADPH-dependent curcumin reductase CurA
VLETTEIIWNDRGLPLTAFLGSMGMTGLTAYGSLIEIARPRQGEVMFLSGAAGAVGLV